jgi:hypothetical protein
MSTTNIIQSSTPQQNIFFKPFTQTFNSFYNHDTQKHNFYINPTFGKFCKVLGHNTIIEGFSVIDYNFTNNNLIINVSKGRIIINDTYIEISNDSQVIYENANLLDENGFFVLSASFLNANTLRSNKLRIHLTYFDHNNNSHTEFDHSKDKVILGVFDFDKDNNSNVISSFNMRNIETITLDSINYNIRNVIHKYIDSIVDVGPVGFNLDDLPSGTYLGQSQSQLLAITSSNGNLITFINFE